MMTNLRKGTGATGLAMAASWPLGHKHFQVSHGSKRNCLLQGIIPLNTTQIMTNRFENSVDICLALMET